MIYCVCGGRNYGINGPQRAHIFYELNERTRNKDPGLILPDPDTRLVLGGARGTDTAAHGWALLHAVDVQIFQADWNRLGKMAGPVRNQRMIDEGRPDIVLAFPGGVGTADMCRRPLDAGISVIRCLRLGVSQRLIA